MTARAFLRTSRTRTKGGQTRTPLKGGVLSCPSPKPSGCLSLSSFVQFGPVFVRFETGVVAIRKSPLWRRSLPRGQLRALAPGDCVAWEIGMTGQAECNQRG